MKRILFIALVVFTTGQCFAQTFFDTAIKKSWKGKGQLMGADAKFHMQWEAVLEGQFYRLTFKNERKIDKDKSIFRAIAFYKVMDNDTFEGTWFDSRGISFPLKGTFEKNQLVVDWGSPDTELGKTIYTVQDDGRIAVEDHVEQNGKSIRFGKAIYK